MTFGNNFLQRLSEGIDSDKINDGFSIPLDTQQKSLVSRMKRPLEKRVTGFHVLAGIPGRFLNKKDIEASIAAAADTLRVQLSVRRQFDKMYNALAEAKGFSTPESIEEDTKNTKVEAFGVKGMKSTQWRKVFKDWAAFEKWLEKMDGDVEVHGTARLDQSISEGKKADGEEMEAYGVKGMKSTQWRKKFNNWEAFEKWLEKMDGDVEVYGTRRLNESLDIDFIAEAELKKRGGFIQKLFGSVLVELGLPDSYVQVGAPSAVSVALLKTARLIEEDSSLERLLRLLAIKMGVSAKETVEESFMCEAIDAGNDAYADAIVNLIADLGIPDQILQVRRAQVIKALREKKMSQQNKSEVMRKIQLLSDALAKGAKNNSNTFGEDA